MVKFELTVHAQTVAQARAIEAAWVASTLAAPELLLPDRDDPELMHALAKIPARENRVLRVVYNATTNPARVVTVFFDRTMRDKL